MYKVLARKVSPFYIWEKQGWKRLSSLSVIHEARTPALGHLPRLTGSHQVLGTVSRVSERPLQWTHGYFPPAPLLQVTNGRKVLNPWFKATFFLQWTPNGLERREYFVRSLGIWSTFIETPRYKWFGGQALSQTTVDFLSSDSVN